MSYPVKVSVEVVSTAGASHSLADFTHLTLSQHVLTHHTFALGLSCEALGKALGMKPEVVPIRAHEELSGGAITLSWTSALPGSEGRSFRFKGLVTHVSVHTDSDLESSYHLSGYSPTYLLEDGTQNRTFVKKSLRDIFAQVLGAYHHNSLHQELQPASQQVLPYTVQYHENAFSFLSCLAARHNEWFYYDGETLRLGPGPDRAVAFKGNSAQNFALSMHLQPGKTEAAAYNYRSHAALKAQAAAAPAGHALSQYAVQKSDELFLQPHRLPGAADVRDQAGLQRTLNGLATKRAGSQVSLEGSGETFDIIPGCVLDVQDAVGTAYGKFRVLAVRHEIDGDGNYQNHFEAQPAATATPPPNPLYAAADAQPELAEVIDLQDPKRLGRVRVRYHWAVAQPTDAESAWLRVSTPYSGDGKGQLFTPEVGSQVLVGYEHGLAELPVVLGNLFHPQNPQAALYTHPQNNLKGMQTAGGNKFVMLETAGAQTILISNSNKKDTAIAISFQGDGRIDIQTNGSINLTAGKDISLQAGKSITLQANEDINLIAKRKVGVEALDEDVALRAQKEVLLTAMSGDLTLEAAAKKTLLKAADNIEVTAANLVKLNGSDVKLNS